MKENLLIFYSCQRTEIYLLIDKMYLTYKVFIFLKNRKQMLKRDLDSEKSWQKTLSFVESLIGKKPSDLNGVLFLIGVQELGRGSESYSKEQKQDLIHIGICKVLSYSGYYQLEGLDEEGWPHWKPSKELPYYNVSEQEKLLKMHVIEYFEKEFN